MKLLTKHRGKTFRQKKYYKAFQPDMTGGIDGSCKQYSINKVFKEDGDKIGEKGVMHFCENPFNTFEVYKPFVYGNFRKWAIIRPLSKILHRREVFASNKIFVEKRLSFKELLKECVSYAKEKCNKAYNGILYICKPGLFTNQNNQEQIGIESFNASVINTGNHCKIIDATDTPRNKKPSTIINHGNYCRSYSTARQIVMNNGWDFEAILLESYSEISSSGEFSHILSEGKGSLISSSGYGADINSKGDYTIVSSIGDNAFVSLNGRNSIGCCLGLHSEAKGNIGDWIILAEWAPEETGGLYPKNVKCAQIDGKVLKPNKYYRLRDGKFVESCSCLPYFQKQ